VFDFVARFEKLEEYFALFKQLVNRVRRPDLPQVTFTLAWTKAGNITASLISEQQGTKEGATLDDMEEDTAGDEENTDLQNSTCLLYSQVYSSCGERCARGIADWYKGDFRMFGFPNPTRSK
jgi:hypothetical protein